MPAKAFHTDSMAQLEVQGGERREGYAGRNAKKRPEKLNISQCSQCNQGMSIQPLPTRAPFL